VIIVGAALIANTTNSGRSKLPSITAAALISALREDRTNGFSGTLLMQMSLSLPVSADATIGGAPIMLSAGAHTMRFWYGGVGHQRVALLTPTSENDVFQVGSDLWQWDSATKVATHSRLPAAAQAGIGAPISPAPLTIAALTPQQLTERTLASVDRNTEVTVTDGDEVADRPTYDLVLEPGGSANTLIDSVHIEVDAAQKVALGVQVYARGVSEPSIDVSFTSVTYKTPASSYFAFSPPSGSKVVPGAQPQIVTASPDAGTTATIFAASAIGWSAITEYRSADGTEPPSVAPMRAAMRPVSGTWGTGSLLQTPLLCMLVSDDGRVFSGSVAPAMLYAAAAVTP
jgi:hypothetical protein